MRPSIVLFSAIAASATLHGQVVINEIHHSPRDKTAGEEFVELYNNGVSTADLSGWYFSDGISFTFPDGTQLEAGDYLVVASDPDALIDRFGPGRVVGPFAGGLSGRGEQLILRNADGVREDEVDYGDGFPWPVVGGRSAPNYSIELAHPDLDNDLGASWRPSNPSLNESNALLRSRAVWRYRKGTSEPPSTWRTLEFDDADWSVGTTSIGYGDGDDSTELSDMRNSYSSVYLRHRFTIEPNGVPAAVQLRLYVDDGAAVWINGSEVHRAHVSGGALAYDDFASNHEAEWEEISLGNAPSFLVEGDNVIAIHALNATIGSSDFSIDAELLTTSASAAPTPGRANAVFSPNIGPQLRQVNHSPREPVSGMPVYVSVKATDPDGVTGVTLSYQTVDPGEYIGLSDPEYQDGWTDVSLHDDGLGGDELAGDDVYTVELPGALHVHRRLVRFRLSAMDGAGNEVRAPFPEDPVPNFAYFVYDGVPSWTGARRPGVASVEYSSDLLESIPVYHFITDRQDHLNAIHVPYRWNSPDEETPTSGSYGGSDYRWEGTLVYEGRVYDHIRFRARGGVWRYSMGKNMWKFDFPRGHSFAARDDFGRRYRARWDKLNFSALIQQGNFRQRGEQGLFEAVGFRLHNLAGNPASKTHYVHYRLITGPDEVGPDQWSGDFQGLYLAIEQLDGRFLDEHGIPDGNLYKMEGGTGELNNQGPTHPTDKSDLNAFKGTYEGSSPSASWWRANLDLDEYYSFRTIVLAIHDYDIHAGKNYFYFINPETELWTVYNWDLDLCWTTTYNGGGGRGPLNQHVLDPFAEFRLEYRNRVRELRDLLFNPDQTGMLLDEVAGVVYEAGAPSFVDADRAMWDYNPILVSDYINSTKAGHGRYYEFASNRTFAGMVNVLKSYVSSRGSWLDSNEASDSAIPNRPTMSFTGPAGFPIDALTFEASAFSDPQGSGTFGAMTWRVAEVDPGDTPPFDPEQPKPVEIEADWESGELTTYQSEMTIPAGALSVGKTYRARVKMMDNSGRWSRWSAPVEFVAGPPTAPFPQQGALRVTEMMYHPVEGVDYEFIEMQNVSGAAIDLTPVSFSDGIQFHFAGSAVTTLGPGEYVVVVENEAVFRSKYPDPNIQVAGEYEGRLANSTEVITLQTGGNSIVLEYVYDDAWYPLTDGGGHSLTVVDPLADSSSWSTPLNWKESTEPDGTPGTGDSGGPLGGIQRPGDSNQDGGTDIADAVALLRQLFGDRNLPCGDTLGDPGNVALLDVNGDDGVNIADVVYLLEFLFAEGAPPEGGTNCIRIDGCPNACAF